MSDYIPADETNEHALTDDDIMRFTQGTRKRFVDEIIKDGFPNNPKDQHVLLNALADMDRTALGNKRIGANERQAAADALVARAIAQISQQFGGDNPFQQGQGQVPTFNAELLPDAEPAPGETDVGLSDQTYKALAEKYD